MKKQKLLTEFIILTISVAIIESTVFFFLIPSHTAVSSVSGLSIVLSHFVAFTVSEITFALNMFLLLIGFFLCGKEFGAKTVYTSIMLPAFMKLFEII